MTRPEVLCSSCGILPSIEKSQLIGDAKREILLKSRNNLKDIKAKQFLRGVSARNQRIQTQAPNQWSSGGSRGVWWHSRHCASSLLGNNRRYNGAGRVLGVMSPPFISRVHAGMHVIADEASSAHAVSYKRSSLC